MKILDLVEKCKWYDMIECGGKPEEYRADSPYWIKRFTGLDLGYLPFSYRNGYEKINQKGYTHVRFHRAYTKTTMLFELNDIVYDHGNASWGAWDDKLFKLKLGKRIQ